MILGMSVVSAFADRGQYMGKIETSISGNNPDGSVSSGSEITYTVVATVDESQDTWTGSDFFVRFDPNALEYKSFSWDGGIAVENTDKVGEGTFRIGNMFPVNCRVITVNVVFTAKRDITLFDNTEVIFDAPTGVSNTDPNKKLHGFNAQPDFDTGDDAGLETLEGLDANGQIRSWVVPRSPYMGSVETSVSGVGADGIAANGSEITYTVVATVDESQDTWTGSDFFVRFDPNALEYKSFSWDGGIAVENTDKVGEGTFRIGNMFPVNCRVITVNVVFTAKRDITLFDNTEVIFDAPTGVSNTDPNKKLHGFNAQPDFDTGDDAGLETLNGLDANGQIRSTVATADPQLYSVEFLINGDSEFGWPADYTGTLPDDTEGHSGDTVSFDVLSSSDTAAQDGTPGTWSFEWSAVDAAGAAVTIEQSATNNGASVTIVDSDITVTGTWTFNEADVYYIHFEYTGDVPSDVTAPPSVSVHEGDFFPAFPPIASTSQTTFGGRAGRFIAPNDWTLPATTGIVMPAEDVTATAEWVFEAIYNVTFAIEGDSEFGSPLSYEGSVPGDTTARSGEFIVMPLLSSSDAAAADGTPGTWSFEWTAVDENGDPVPVLHEPNNLRASFPISESDVHVTGKWTFYEADTYYITFSYTGDVPYDVTAPSRVGYHEGEIILSMPRIAETSQTSFGGKAGSFTAPTSWTFEPEIRDGVMPGEHVTATAEWIFTADPDAYPLSYSVSEDPVYGAPASFFPDIPAEANYHEGNDLTKVIIDPLSTEETTAVDGQYQGSWSFSGWDNIPPDCVMPAGEVVLTGSWSFIEDAKYSVIYSFDGYGPDLDLTDPIPAEEEYYAGAIVTIADDLTTTDNEFDGMKVVWSFDGWSYDGKIVSGTMEMPEETVYLVGSWSWEEAQKYRLTFAVEGDAPASFSTPEALDLAEGYEFYEGDEVLIDGKAPTDKSLLFTTAEKTNAAGKKGTWTFSWDVKGALKDGKYMPGADTVIIGSWSFKASGSGGGGGGGTTKYTLSYNTNGGSSIKSETYEAGTTVKLTKVPSRIGYRFNGWFSDKALSDPVDSVKMNSDKTVYAGWLKTDVPAWLDGENHFAYVLGYPNGTVLPEDNITRAEVATIFFRLLKSDVRSSYLSSENEFTDVNEGDWFNTAVSTMAKMGIVTGYSDGSYRPNEAITRAEFTAIAARFDSKSSGATEGFGDAVDHWAQRDIEKAAANGWVGGYEDGSFRPNSRIKRAEAIAIINRVLSRNPGSEKDLLDGMITFSDNADKTKWYYLDIQEAANGHSYTRNADGSEKWTKLNNNVDWTEYQE